VITHRLVATVLILVIGNVAFAQPAALRVVVIEGEDAVNIIQQKTAVRPIVEVRDRNNLPVPGAVVTFSIQGGASTFGGASTLTIATNAAGQAAVTGLTPSAAGAFQIQVSAAFQGQVATATIAQTNVMTAAQAAAAAGATSGGGSAGSAGGGAGGGAGGTGAGAAGGAGGLSTTTLVVAGAAVAGGAVAATQIVDKVGGKAEYAGTFSGTITGNFSSSATGPMALNCAYTKTASATGTLKFKEDDSRGEFKYEGSETITSTTCPGGAVPPGQMFIGQVDVTGSAASFNGRSVYPGPSTPSSFGGTITGEHIYTFQGSIAGDTATGVFTYEENSLSTGTVTVRQLGTGTFNVTMQKK
jgi:hypothetical protein